MKKKIEMRVCDLFKNDTKEVCGGIAKHKCVICNRDVCDFHMRSLYSNCQRPNNYITTFSTLGTGTSYDESHGRFCMECLKACLKDLKKMKGFGKNLAGDKAYMANEKSDEMKDKKEICVCPGCTVVRYLLCCDCDKSGKFVFRGDEDET